MKKTNTISGQCPCCNIVSTYGKWNKRSIEAFDHSILTLEEAQASDGELLYVCPHCSKEVEANEINKIVMVNTPAKSEFPVAVTMSYTMYVDANSPEEAVAAAELMDTSTLLSYVSENPTIEVEEIDDDILDR